MKINFHFFWLLEETIKLELKSLFRKICNYSGANETFLLTRFFVFGVCNFEIEFCS